MTDLGTEFGVEVGPAGATEAHVFVGRVAVLSAAGRGSGQTKRIISAGSAARVDGKAGGVTITVLNEDRFVRVLPPQRILSDHGHTYASMVLSMKPVVYYRMEQPKEEKDRFTLFDSAPAAVTANCIW